MELIVLNVFDAWMTSHVIGLSLCQCLTFNFHWNSWKKVRILTYRWLAQFLPTILAWSMNFPQKIKLETRQFQKMKIYLPWILATLQNAEKNWVPLTGLETPGYSQRKSGARSCVTQWRRIACWSLRPRRAIGMASSRPRTEVDWRFFCVRFFLLQGKSWLFRWWFQLSKICYVFTADFCKDDPIWRAQFFFGWVEKNHQLAAVECSHFFGGGGWEKGIFDWLSGWGLAGVYIYIYFFFLFGFYWLNAKQHKSMAMGKLT